MAGYSTLAANYAMAGDHRTALEARYNEARARVERPTSAILAKAFRGKLVPQNSNDEPASVLLERIRAEREKGEEKRVKGKKG